MLSLCYPHLHQIQVQFQSILAYECEVNLFVGMFHSTKPVRAQHCLTGNAWENNSPDNQNALYRWLGHFGSFYTFPLSSNSLILLYFLLSTIWPSILRRCIGCVSADKILCSVTLHISISFSSFFWWIVRCTVLSHVLFLFFFLVTL